MTRFLFSVALAAWAAPGLAAEPTPALMDYLRSHVMGFAETPAITDAILLRNGETAAYPQSRIDALDRRWRREVGTGASALVDSVVLNPVADLLRQRVAAAGGTITEVFVMDARGLNVAASSATSDYWQGDEAKFLETYGKGPGAAHFSAIAFDESSQSYQAQISLTITDPESGAAIGAVTVGINAEDLL